MTKKDYIKFAGMLKTEREMAKAAACCNAVFVTLSGVEDALVSIFYEDNPRFDEARFRLAADVPGTHM